MLAPALRALACPPVPGTYLTDGLNLYYVVETVAGEMIRIEDCATLESGCYTPGQIALMDLVPAS